VLTLDNAWRPSALPPANPLDSLSNPINAVTDWRNESMATTESTTRTDLQELAQRHLWLHFARMGGYGEAHEIPIIARGEGCYVWDDHGKKYLDALSALFCVNIGHGRHDVAQAGADQARELGFFTNWSYAHPPAIELAARIAALAPGDLNRVLLHQRRLGGRRGGAQARPPVPQAHGRAEQDEGHRARDRLPRRPRSAR
jgi:4-aminobutyrate aminotransferase-like enzyme